MTRIYQEDRNEIPTDVVAAKGSQVLFGQGLRVELDNGKQFFDVAPAFVVSFDSNLHGHLTKGEWDVLWLPKDLSPEAQRLAGLTWFGGYRASTAEWQPKVHGTDFNHANTFEIAGNAFTDLVSIPLWLNDGMSSELQEIGNRVTVFKFDKAEEENRFKVTKNLNPLDYVNGDPYTDPFNIAAAITIPTVAAPIFRKRKQHKTK